MLQGQEKYLKYVSKFHVSPARRIYKTRATVPLIFARAISGPVTKLGSEKY